MKTDMVLNENVEKGKGFDESIVIKLHGPNSRPSKDLWIAYCKDEKDIRKAAENKMVDIIIGLEEAEYKDSLHVRNSGLNEVICQLAHKNDISIGFSFNKLLHSNQRTLLLGRMMQNVELCRKYRVKMLTASFAETKWDLRSYNELFSFVISLGMTPKEAKDSLEAAAKILKEKKEEKLPSGIRMVKE